MPIATNLTDATASATTHADHHNQLAAVANQSSSAMVPWFGSGRWFCHPASNLATSGAVTNSTLNGHLMMVPNAITITKIAMVCASAVASSLMEIYVHNVDTSTGNPSTRLAFVSLVGTATGTVSSTLGSPMVFTQPTPIWVGWRHNGTSPTVLAIPSTQNPFNTYDTLPTSAGTRYTMRTYSYNYTTPTAVPNDLSAAGWSANAGNMVAVFFGS